MLKHLACSPGEERRGGRPVIDFPTGSSGRWQARKEELRTRGFGREVRGLVLSSYRDAASVPELRTPWYVRCGMLMQAQSQPHGSQYYCAGRQTQGKEE